MAVEVMVVVTGTVIVVVEAVDVVDVLADDDVEVLVEVTLPAAPVTNSKASAYSVVPLRENSCMVFGGLNEIGAEVLEAKTSWLLLGFALNSSIQNQPEKSVRCRFV